MCDTAVDRVADQSVAGAPWPIKDLLLLGFVCAGINHPIVTPAHLHYPHYCKTIARLLRII